LNTFYVVQTKATKHKKNASHLYSIINELKTANRRTNFIRSSKKTEVIILLVYTHNIRAGLPSSLLKT